MNPNLLKGCAPIFKDGFCCPVDWICPLPVEEPRLITVAPPAPVAPPPSVAIASSVRCPPGINPRPDYRDYLMPPLPTKEIEVDKLGTRVSLFNVFLKKGGKI